MRSKGPFIILEDHSSSLL